MEPPPSNSDYKDNKDYVRVLLYSYHTTITGWGVLPRDSSGCLRRQKQAVAGLLHESGLHLYTGLASASHRAIHLYHQES